MLFEVLYTFVLDDEVKRPDMHVDIDDYDTRMRLLEIGSAGTARHICPQARPRSLRRRSTYHAVPWKLCSCGAALPEIRQCSKNRALTVLACNF